MIRIGTAIVWRLLFFVLGGWCVLVLLFSPMLESGLRLPSAGLLALLILATLWRPHRYRLMSISGMAAVMLLWGQLEPSNDRDWQRDVAKAAWAKIEGDEVTVYNVRDFLYRSETDFDERYTTKTVRLSELTSMDLFASYWAGKSIAHIFLSFGFAQKDHIAFSIEVRKTKSQAYSTIDGFFRNFELIYVVAEERDLVGLRTIYRQPNEQVYLLRLNYIQENAIKLFLEYLKKLNALVEHPAFYNTLTTNCTTQVLYNAQDAIGADRFRYNWRLFLSGYTPEYLYMVGSLDERLPMQMIMDKGLVNARAQDVSDAAAFSRMIREGVPNPHAASVE
jgi:hypothetical protein